MNDPREILKKYWGYDAFRPLQEDIIQSALKGRDTLALLPTGGGKSICFQVPAMAMDGICIVVSPLIALMKDQVGNLQKRGIKALSITSENSASEVDAMFDRCIYGDIKFVYLSPERLQTPMARMRIAQMKVALIAVDEAHCISEWGYDFRPPYLRIADLREILPEVPIMALTASATPIVVKDIQDKLLFRNQQVFAKSFARTNLAYQVLWLQDKLGTIERIARKQKGSGIVYMRNRRGTERIARELAGRGLSVHFYHAGLDSNTRHERQKDWMSNKVQIICATNAFGMGIDKPDVRFVIHLDLPDTMENYYQECGRGGRDGEKAFAIALVDQANVNRLREKLEESFPEKDRIKAVYNQLGTQLQLAVGSGLGEKFELDVDRLAAALNIPAQQVWHSLKFLEREGYLSLQESGLRRSGVLMTCGTETIAGMRQARHALYPLIEVLMRSHTHLFEEEQSISEWSLGNACKWSKEKVISGLERLHEMEVLRYRQASELPGVTYLCERLDPKNVKISREHYQLRKKIVTEKTEAMIFYVEHRHKCRSRLILEYFGETEARDCGQCDYCLRQKGVEIIG